MSYEDGDFKKNVLRRLEGGTESLHHSIKCLLSAINNNFNCNECLVGVALNDRSKTEKCWQQFFTRLHKSCIYVLMYLFIGS